MRYFT